MLRVVKSFSGCALKGRFFFCDSKLCGVFRRIKGALSFSGPTISPKPSREFVSCAQ